MRCQNFMCVGLLFAFVTAWPQVSLGQSTPKQTSPATNSQRNDNLLDRQTAVEALHRAVAFFREHASAGGGYVYQLSENLAKREGEGKVGNTTAWIQPPATPSVGMAYLRGFQWTGDPVLLDAAKETADALLRGQLLSGGWDNKIEFDTDDRKGYAYRVDGDSTDKRRNVTTFDDDKSQSAIRFLMQLDQELEFADATQHEACRYALDAFVKAQYACGAWPQRYSDFPDPDSHPPIQASFPETWPRTYSGNQYAGFYTLNDNTMSDLIETMLDAWQIYGQPSYLQAAQRGGDFLRLAQLPSPQPGWAQQYNREMQPAWARKFEPPALTGGESQGVMRTLIQLYRRTAAVDKDAGRFLEPIPSALAYYRHSALADGRLARFYELGTNRPLFFTGDYELTYVPDDLPTHYAFIVSSKLDSVERELRNVRETPVDDLWKPRKEKTPEPTSKLAGAARKVIAAMDERGAWVESGRLKYHDDDDRTRRVIRSDTFIENLETLSRWIAAAGDPRRAFSK